MRFAVSPQSLAALRAVRENSRARSADRELIPSSWLARLTKRAAAAAGRAELLTMLISLIFRTRTITLGNHSVALSLKSLGK